MTVQTSHEPEVLHTAGWEMRKERNEKIVELFSTLREQYPTSSVQRICVEIQKSFPTLQALSIRLICKRAGVC